MQQSFRIAGSARYLPKTVITDEDLDTRLGLSHGWTRQHTGVLRRYRAIWPETAASMARDVILEAIRDAGTDLSAVDVLIDASLCQQQPVPCNAALIQEALGPRAAGIPCFDVHASCLGFVAALQVVNGLFASGAMRRAVVVCTETPLEGVNWNEPESACLMGDGAAAFVLEAQATSTPCAFGMQTYSEGAHLCEVRGGGHLLPAFNFREDNDASFRFHMKGREVHKLASKLLPPLVTQVLEQAKCAINDVDVVPHQASGPAVELLGRRLGIAPERLHNTISEHGNLVAASIPYVLHGVRKQRPHGTRVMLVGTAAGYTQAAVIFEL